MTVLMEAFYNRDEFIPALFSKNYGFPIDYRSRCNELVKIGLLKKIDPVVIDGVRMSAYSITAKGIGWIISISIHEGQNI